MAQKSRPAPSGEALPAVESLARANGAPVAETELEDSGATERTVVRRRPRKRQLTPRPAFRAVALDALPDAARSTIETIAPPQPAVASAPPAPATESTSATTAKAVSLAITKTPAAAAPEAEPAIAEKTTAPSVALAAAVPIPAPEVPATAKPAAEPAREIRTSVSPSPSPAAPAEPDLNAAWMRAGNDVAKAAISLQTAMLETWIAVPAFNTLLKEQLKAYNASIDVLATLAKQPKKP